MKKKMIITIIIIALVLLGGLGYAVFQDLNQEKKLNVEIEELDGLLNFEENMDTSEIEKRLDRVVTKNDYAIVETAYKQYVSDFYNNAMEITNILNDGRISNSLTAQNYKKDGPEFTETKEYLSATKEKLETCKQKYYDLLTDEKVMSYIDGKGLDDYYVDYYKQEVVGNLEEEKNDKTIETSLNDIIDLLNNSQKVIDFLAENKGKWKVEDEKITFIKDSLYEDYNNLITAVY